jgi:hypothetical protein
MQYDGLRFSRQRLGGLGQVTRDLGQVTKSLRLSTGGLGHRCPWLAGTCRRQPQVPSRARIRVSWVSGALSLGGGARRWVGFDVPKDPSRVSPACSWPRRPSKSLPTNFFDLRTQLGGGSHRQGGMQALRGSRRGREESCP